jgi:uncharacterized protein YukE
MSGTRVRRFQSFRHFLLPLAASALACAPGCQSAYYSALEKFGVHKREILVDRVEEARDSQREAKEQFRSALEQFRSVVKVEPSELEEVYDRLQASLDRSESRAKAVHERIGAVEDVSSALFDEWEGELKDYHDPALRRASEKELGETRDRYEQLIGVMRRAEGKMQPVLDRFGDQVLFLKHNLNARAIASLQGEFAGLQGDVEGLVKEMEASIAEADRFVKTLQG